MKVKMILTGERVGVRWRAAISESDDDIYHWKWWYLHKIGENEKRKWRWHRYHWKWKWCCLPTRWRDKCLSCSPLSVSTTRRDTHAPLKHLTIIRWEDHDDVMLILWWWCGIEIIIIWWYYDGDVVLKSWLYGDLMMVMWYWNHDYMVILWWWCGNKIMTMCNFVWFFRRNLFSGLQVMPIQIQRCCGRAERSEGERIPVRNWDSIIIKSQVTTHK